MNQLKIVAVFLVAILTAQGNVPPNENQQNVVNQPAIPNPNIQQPGTPDQNAVNIEASEGHKPQAEQNTAPAPQSAGEL